jgi:hypothetical protein
MFNKKIDSHNICENNEEISISYNKKFFKSNKILMLFYFSLYFCFTAFILSKIVVSDMNLYIGIQVFFSFILSTFFLIKITKEIDVEKKYLILKQNYLINKNYVIISNKDVVHDKISIKNIIKIKTEKKNKMNLIYIILENNSRINIAYTKKENNVIYTILKK